MWGRRSAVKESVARGMRKTKNGGGDQKYPNTSSHFGGWRLKVAVEDERKEVEATRVKGKNGLNRSTRIASPCGRGGEGKGTKESGGANRGIAG